MSSDPVPPDANIRELTRPRPGHADLAGGLKYQTHDLRDILERASARETAARVAVGSFCRQLLKRFRIEIGSHVLAIGREMVDFHSRAYSSEEILRIDPVAPVRCVDSGKAKNMMEEIDAAKKAGDTLGGIVEVIATNVPPGLGSHAQWDRKLDGRLAHALMSLHAVKAVEIGEGIASARSLGSQVHDEIFYDASERRFYRKTNRAGGLEAGISNGAEIRARIYVKPIPTLRKPLMSVDVVSKDSFEAAFERSDTCVVSPAGVVAEAILATVLAEAFLEKFGGDSITEIHGNYVNYQKLLEQY